MSGIEHHSSPRIYWDTNIFIETFEGPSDRRSKLTALLLAGWRAPRPFFATSELTLAELLVGPIEARKDDLIQLYENWTLPNRHMDVIPIDRSVLRNAALLRALNKSLKLPDAIHLASAKAAQCQQFLTCERRLSGNYGIEVLVLTEEVLDELGRRYPFVAI
jgi:predicted nucleic acid-binding protein